VRMPLSGILLFTNTFISYLNLDFIDFDDF